MKTGVLIFTFPLALSSYGAEKNGRNTRWRLLYRKLVDMYTSLYFYRVPKKHTEAFLAVQKKSAEIYKKNGAIEDWTFGPENLNPKYGCSSLLKEIMVNEAEELFFSLSLFKDKDDHDIIMSLVDKDPEIEKLYNQVCQMIDLSKVVRGEFNRLV